MALKPARTLRELRKELELASATRGQILEWTASEQLVLGQISSVLDRNAELLALYNDAVEVDAKVKLSGEVRLLESAAARMVKDTRTDLPKPATLTTLRHSARSTPDGPGMPRAKPAVGPGYQVPGLYAKLQQTAAKNEAQTGHCDPRVFLTVSADEWARRERDCGVLTAVIVADKMESAQPLIVQRWRVAPAPSPELAPPGSPTVQSDGCGSPP